MNAASEEQNHVTYDIYVSIYLTETKANRLRPLIQQLVAPPPEAIQ